MSLAVACAVFGDVAVFFYVAWGERIIFRELCKEIRGIRSHPHYQQDPREERLHLLSHAASSSHLRQLSSLDTSLIHLWHQG